MELSVSMHAGSKKNAIKNLDKIKKIDEHNNRKYKNVNNKEIDPTLSNENMTLRGSKNITNDVKELYKKEFAEATYNYNLKQKDERRKVVDYLDKMNKDEKNNIAVEFIYQVGDAETWKGRSLEDKKKTKEIFEKAIDILEAKGIKVANATIHFDETSPHMHIVGVPIIEGQTRGLEKQVSQRKVLTREVLKELREKTEKAFIEEYKRVYKNNDVILKKGSEIEEHLSVEDYKSTKKMLEVAKKYGNRKELKEEIEKKVDEVEKEIEGLENENKNLTNKLTNLEEKNYSLNTEVKELETSKKTKEKEKDDIEKELDLYQKKIKDYKEQIIKDKENLEKEEEEQKRLEKELKEIEKKVKEIKEEIDRKNKEYNDHLTEKNKLEEKKKKLEEDKKNIENAYNLEKVNILSDAEEKRKELLKEKDDLENDITKIKEFIITQKSIKNEREQEAEDYKKIKEESEKLQKDKKETEDLIKSLTLEKTRLESEKDELKDIVQNYLEKQKDYNSILTPALQEITKEEKKKDIIETVKDTIIQEYDTINIKLEVEGVLDNESRYNKEYKLFVEARKDNKKADKEILSAEEKENLAYNLASASYTMYSNNFDKMEINYNTGDGKTKVEILHDYDIKDKIEFEPTRLDNFIILIKEKVNDFKNAIVDSLKQKFGYTNIEKDNYFNKEQNQKNIDKKKFDIDY